MQPRARRVLVIAPHMDDEVIPCGGTLLLLRAAKAEVHVLFASDSSAGIKDKAAAAQLSATRREEAGRVRTFIDVTSMTELGFTDGQLVRHEKELASAFTEQLAALNPDLVLCPFPADGHSDHMACAAAFAVACSRSNWRGRILAYEVWTPLWPNVVVDISSVAERKEQAIRLYQSQVSDRDYAAAALGLNRFRGLVHSIAYAEAFYDCDPQQYVNLAALLDDIC